VVTDEDGMGLAIAQAREGLRENGGGEVGCAIVRDGIVLHLAHNEVERRKDPTAHAEMVAIRDLCGRLGVTDLKGCTMYCTLQPCGMCSLACCMGGDQPHRLRCHADGCKYRLLRDPARKHGRLHTRLFS
jgi:tRNA(Arg) A34 adenosine deaminase TadA